MSVTADSPSFTPSLTILIRPGVTHYGWRDVEIQQLTNSILTLTAPAVVLESGRPPTGHQQRRHGWQAGDRSRSRSPPKLTEDERTKSQVARSYSERLTDSRSVHWQGSQAEVSVPGTADPAGRRSVRWKEDVSISVCWMNGWSVA